MTLNLLISYARKDILFMQMIVNRLEPLQQQGAIDILSDEIDHEQQEPNAILIRVANIILLLVSPDFLNTSYCYSLMIKKMIEMHESGNEARVIPIILRPVYWQATPFSKLPVVPYNAKPISTWHNQADALSEVITTVHKTIKILDSFSTYSSSERFMVEQMLRDQDSIHWEECRKVVRQRVYVRAKNIPLNRREEIIQEVMVKLVRYLPSFHFQCALQTWLNFIIESCVIDVHRNVRNKGQILGRPEDMLNEHEYEGDGSEAWSAEDTFLMNEELHNAIAALWEYAGMHSNPTRDRLIIRMVIFEGYNHVETAKVAGCNAPVVGHVVREAQRYVREKIGHNL